MTAFVQVPPTAARACCACPCGAALPAAADPAQADKSGASAKTGAGPGTGGARRDAGSRVYKLVDGTLKAVPVQVGISDASYLRCRGRRRQGRRQCWSTRDLSGQGGPQSQIRLRMF